MPKIVRDRVVLIDGVRITLGQIAWLHTLFYRPSVPYGAMTVDNVVVKHEVLSGGERSALFNGKRVSKRLVDRVIDILQQNESNLYPNKDGIYPCSVGSWRILGRRLEVVSGNKRSKTKGLYSGGQMLQRLLDAVCKTYFGREDLGKLLENITSSFRLSTQASFTPSRPFGTIIVDPPWPYRKVVSRKSGGYSNEQYSSLTLNDICCLPVGKLSDYVFLWTTPAFHGPGEVFTVAEKWGLKRITTIYWVKGTGFQAGEELAFSFKPSYGVGYWFRGCVEPILICKQPRVKSIRTPWVGLISPNAQHSRKPESLYEIIESNFPGPYCELFARSPRKGWASFGDEAPEDGKDIRESLDFLVRKKKKP